MPAFVDIRGRKFGRLTVRSRSKTRSGHNIMWTCICDCGNVVRVTGANLKSGNTRSCGCLAAELIGAKSNTAQAMLRKRGVYIPASSEFYRQAGSIIAKAKRDQTKIGFDSIADLVVHLKEITPKKCPVFGFRFEHSHKGPNPKSPSADRINPKEGYIKGNLQIVSVLANRMKRDATPKELQQFAKWVLK